MVLSTDTETSVVKTKYTPCMSTLHVDQTSINDRYVRTSTPMRTPSKPCSSKILGIQRQIENQLLLSSDRRKNSDEISPTLAKLRNTPAGLFEDRRKKFIIQHTNISKRSGQLNVNGGVCLWPQMGSMQMTRLDILWLLGQGILLSLLTVIILIKFHGKTFADLRNSTNDIKDYCDNHFIDVNSQTASVPEQVSLWHKTLLKKTETLQRRFDVSGGSAAYYVYILGYIIGLSGLFFCLYTSLRAKNRLTPPYIRIWTCLLSVICTWTVVISMGLFWGYQIEVQVVNCIQKFSLLVGNIGSSTTDLAAHQSILLYWKSRFLDSPSHGLIHILGPITINHILHYLIYYSIPIFTVLVGPVIKLFISCWNLYGKSS